MQPITRVTNWRPGDFGRIGVHVDELANAIRAAREQEAFGPAPEESYQAEEWDGIIVGPKPISASQPGIPDLAGEQYYVQRCVVSGYGGVYGRAYITQDPHELPAIDKSAGNPKKPPTGGADRPVTNGIYVVTNIAERDPGNNNDQGSHQLPRGMGVRVWAEYDRGGPQHKRYLMCVPFGNAFVVKILNAYSPSGSNITGKYDGVMYLANNTAAGAAGVAMPESLFPRGVPANPTSCLVINMEEDLGLGYAAAHNNLQPGTFALGVLGGMSTEATPRQVVFIRGGVAPMDSGGAKIQIGGAAAAEGGDTVDTATWNRLNNSVSMTAWVPSRVEYNDSGDQILYQFFRLWSFDARGLLVSVGAESRVVVDAPTVCGTVPGGGGSATPASSFLLMGA